MTHAVALALGTARVGHFGECGKQDSKWHRATSRSWKAASIQPLRHPAAAHAQAAKAELNGPGINVADAASGAVGDITVKKDGAIVLGVEVTERMIDRGRVNATFEQKVTPNGLEDYLFITTVQPDAAALTAAYNYTAVGHEINFVQLQEWLVNNLATVGPRCRTIFQMKMLHLLHSQNADLKVVWNDQMDAAVGQ